MLERSLSVTYLSACPSGTFTFDVQQNAFIARICNWTTIENFQEGGKAHHCCNDGSNTDDVWDDDFSFILLFGFGGKIILAIINGGKSYLESAHITQLRSRSSSPSSLGFLLYVCSWIDMMITMMMLKERKMPLEMLIALKMEMEMAMEMAIGMVVENWIKRLLSAAGKEIWCKVIAVV